MDSDFNLLAVILKDEGRCRIEETLSAFRKKEILDDLIDHCANLPDLNDVVVMERAAMWCGLAFVPSVQIIEPVQTIVQLEELAQIRSVRSRVLGREVIWAAPTFPEFLALAESMRKNPRLRRHLVIIPRRALRSALVGACSEALLDQARNGLALRWPRETAATMLSLSARLVFLAGLLVVLVVFGLLPFLVSPLLAVPAGLYVMLPALLRLGAALGPVPISPPLVDAGPAQWPRYSVVVPLRDEAHMVSTLATALRALDYPRARLEILFAVEETSPDTIAAVRAELADTRFHLVIIPDGAPRTKPKALNYVLPLLEGEFVAIYDAEDIPAPDQIRQAAQRFCSEPDLTCLQAELVVDNAGENALAALFAGEYAGQFGLMLPLLVRLGLPMPLGGTSNHFRVSSLRAVGGWDAFNVTEDADLGIRLARHWQRTGTLISSTYEEAPVHLSTWLRQRTRWMKGWMQTYIVHGRQPAHLLRGLGPAGFIGFHIYVGSLIISAPLHAMFVIMLVAVLIAGHEAQNTPWLVFAAISLAIGYGGPVLLAIAGLRRRNQARRWIQLLLPVYWLLHALAAFRAAAQLLRRPYYWAKTQHGVARQRSTDQPR